MPSLPLKEVAVFYAFSYRHFGDIFTPPAIRVRGFTRESTESIQNDDYYLSFEDKLTHLFFSACNFHCFVDGNKRIAITLSAQMLLLNGYMYCTGRLIQEVENISYHVAVGNIDKSLLHEIITAFLNEEMDAEALKLKIFNAICGP